MPHAADRLEFAPPKQPGFVPAMLLALLAHGLLMVALTWGIQWNRETQVLAAAEAELWSAVPQEAAPEPVAAPPIVQAPPVPPPPPAVKEEPKPEPKPREPDIAEQREREKARQRELEKREEAKRAEAKREEAERKEREKRRAEAEAQKRKDQEKLAAEQKRKAQQEEARVAKLRQENLDRLSRMAGTGPATSAGTAAQSSGPSANWAGRVRARVKPNIFFSDDVAGNPSAEVEVRLAPDGTIVARKLVKSSGNKSWDDAVIRALDKTEVLPRDTDGRVPPSGVLVFRPKD